MHATSPLRSLALLAVSAILITTAYAAVQPRSVSTQPSVAHDYGKLPLSFEANHGQSDPGVRFLSRGDGYAVFLTDSGATLALDKTDSGAVRRNMVEMTLAGSNRAPVRGEQELPGKVNYFVGNDPKQWKADLPTFGKVRYSSVYAGVDLVYYGNQRQLEYDFLVAPGANPAAIQIRFSGPEKVRIADNGDLLLSGGNRPASFHKPVMYQLRNGRREAVIGSFKLLADNTVGFQIESYDHNRELVIDPVLVYSTYLGGAGSTAKDTGDRANGIAVDSTGNVYVVGTTYSANFPVTHAAFQSANHSSPNLGNTVFISKLNASGSALIYSTYLGGSGGDFGYAIALDSSNNAYVTGATYSADFPVTCGAYQVTNASTTAGAATAFVTKLTASGSALAYSTFLGGSGNQSTSSPNGDVSQAIRVSTNGFAYVTGYTYSSDFPVTSGAYQASFGGSATQPNAFVTKINQIGTALDYSTYLGGSGGDYGNALAINAAGNAYIAGSTASANFPTTTGSLQQTLNGSQTVFVTELDATGTDLVYSTYLGGTGGDTGQAIALDSSGFAYVAGGTRSSDFPTTSGVLQGSSYGTSSYFSSDVNAFVAKLNPDGTALSYATYLEGPTTSITGLVVDSSGAAYVSGSAGSQGVGSYGGFQATPDALPTPVTGYTSFILKLDPTASVLNYASLFGGQANGIALDASGNAYLIGQAGTTDFQTTIGALQTASKSTAPEITNAYVSKFAIGAEANETTYPADVSNVPTSMTIVSQVFSWGICDFLWEEFITVDLHTPIPFPAPTGVIDVNNDGGGFTSEFEVFGEVGGDTQVSMENDPGMAAFPQWTASYFGDAVFQPSSVSGDPDVPNCTPDPDLAAALLAGKKASKQPWFTSLKGVGKRKYQIPIRVNGSAASTTSHRSGKGSLQLARFTPAPQVQASGRSSAAQIARPQGVPACIAPPVLPSLVVTLKSVSKLYGAANPSLQYTVSGLIPGDTVTVTPSTTATSASPVGSYAIMATVSGASAGNYAVSIHDGTLFVRKATLGIVANNEVVFYGQTPPPPTGYTFIGLVNGDTTSVISGSPVLSTTVTSSTPPGYYNIQIGVGSLTATNYVFTPFAHPGVVHVDKAPLTVKPDAVSMPVGGPIPTLTYSFTGFVNGESAAGIVTGAPLLSARATTHSAPGTYPIYISVGSLKSNNYRITAVAGVLTITP